MQLCISEPKNKIERTLGLQNIFTKLKNPITDFILKPNFIKILAFIILFKISDSFVKTIEPLFLLDIGFSKIEIANFAKAFSTLSTFLGTFCAPFFIIKFGAFNSLTILYITHSLSHLLFIPINHSDVSIVLLLLAIGVEDFTSGMLQSAFLVFLADIYSPNNREMQNAYIWSIISLTRTIFASLSGSIADIFNNWDMFFLFTFLCTIPVWFLLFNLRAKYNLNNTLSNNLNTQASAS